MQKKNERRKKNRKRVRNWLLERVLQRYFVSHLVLLIRYLYFHIIFLHSSSPRFSNSLLGRRGSQLVCTRICVECRVHAHIEPAAIVYHIRGLVDVYCLLFHFPCNLWETSWYFLPRSVFVTISWKKYRMCSSWNDCSGMRPRCSWLDSAAKLDIVSFGGVVNYLGK